MTKLVKKVLALATMLLYLIIINADAYAYAAERTIPWYKKYYKESNVSDLLDSISENYILVPAPEDYYPPTVYVITETDVKAIEEHSFKYRFYCDSSVELEKVNKELEEYNVKLLDLNESENCYETDNISDFSVRKPITDILKKTKTVLKIEEISELSLISDGGYYVLIESDSEFEQVAEKYKPFGITVERFTENSNKSTKYTYYVKNDHFIERQLSDPEYRRKFEELLNDSSFHLNCYIPANVKNQNMYNKVIYEAYSSEENCGDINDDDKKDITDLSLLSLYLLGDYSLTGDQLSAADIDNNGSINIADLALLRQHLSGVSK
jgi:hypothetical protein